MIISKVHKYIFIAVNKTGTTSVEKFLLENDKTASSNVEIDGEEYNFSPHITAGEIRKKLGVHYEDFRVIGFVRNPYSRVVSSYFFYKKGGKDAWKGRHHERPLKQKLKIEFTQRIPFKLWALLYPYRSNRLYFVDEDGENIVDFIGLFENLASDLEKFLIQGGLHFDFSKFPHTNISSHNKEMTYFNNPLFKRLINLKLKRDLDFYDAVKLNRVNNNY